MAASLELSVMAKDPVEATLDRFSRWAGKTTRELSGAPVVDVGELRLLLDLMRNQLGIDDPAELGRGDIEELLLSVYPRKVTVLDGEDTADTVAAMRDLLAFLAETGVVSGRAVRRLEGELDEVVPRFADAVMDPARWGMAGSFVQAMAADGVDFGDSAAMDRWIARYNAGIDSGAVRDLLPAGAGDADDRGLDGEDDDDYGLKQGFGLPDRLPAMRLPAEDELAAMARNSPLLGRVSRLAQWAGAGRAVTQDGELTAGDTAEAARELGVEISDLDTVGALPGMPSAPDVTSMRDVPELVQLWSLAAETGFFEPDEGGTRVVPGAASRWWRAGADAGVLVAWSDALTFLVTDSLDIDAGLDPRRGADLDFFQAGMGLMVLMFLAGKEGLPFAEASDVIRSAAVAELSAVKGMKAWESWTRAHGDPADVLFGRLAQLGAVMVDAASGGAVARLTPLGSWVIREQFTDAGVEVPLLPPPAEMTAADLVAAAEGMDEEEIAAELDAWLARRAPDEAARELYELAAKGGPVERMVAITALNRLGAGAEPMWRDALNVRELRPYAKIALTELAGGSPEVAMLPGLEPEAEDVAWLLTDILAAASVALEPGELARQLGDSVPDGQEEMMFGVMARLPHPDVADVLTLIGQHHPDRKVAKAARRSAYRASSRLKSAR
jgi:hypothetical protein